MGIEIRKKVSLAPYTTFKIGGPAKFFVEVGSEKELVETLKYTKKNDLEYFFLGGGSNILVSDKGFDGMVIKIKTGNCKVQDEKILCSAGMLLSEVVSKSVENNLQGLEWATGIPGTLGGAIRGNAGAFNGDMSQSVEKVMCLNLEKNKVEEFSNQDCKFGYRTSFFKENKNYLIVSCILTLKKGDDSKESRKKMKEIIKKRKDKQPKESSAGSFFENPEVDPEKHKEIISKFESDTGVTIKENKIPAGWFVEAVDMKGKKIGGAQVSPKHANFIINTGKATAEDVIILSSIIKQKVRTKFHVQLHEEIELVGF